MRQKRWRVTILVLGMFSAAALAQQPPSNLTIGIIDFYGMNKVPVESLRKALPFKEGDNVQLVGRRWAESRKPLEALGIIHASTNLVCCDSGHAIVYIGVQESGAPTLKLHEEPHGTQRLDEEILKASSDFDEALPLAIRAGHADEDDTQGHALTRDPAMRAAQDRFIELAHKSEKQLRLVLRESADAQQRAIAALLLGYVDDKQAVVSDLVYAVSDPSGSVRNNAMRALWVFTKMVPNRQHAVIRVPYEPFVSMLNSPEWSDRNKSSLALMELTQNRDPRLLAMLRRDAMGSLIQMARWKSEGHAMPARVILARIAGYSEVGVRDALAHHDQEAIIAAASKVK